MADLGQRLRYEADLIARPDSRPERFITQAAQDADAREGRPFCPACDLNVNSCTCELSLVDAPAPAPMTDADFG